LGQGRYSLGRVQRVTSRAGREGPPAKRRGANEPKAVKAQCRELGLGDPRRVRQLIAKREQELGRRFTTRLDRVVHVTEAALRRELPALFDEDADAKAERAERAQIAKVNQALSGLREQQEEVAQRLLDGHVVHRLDPLRRQLLGQLKTLNEKVETIASFVKDWDTRLQRQAERRRDATRDNEGQERSVKGERGRR